MAGLHSWMMWGVDGAGTDGLISVYSPSSKVVPSAQGEGRLQDGGLRAGAPSGGAGAGIESGKPMPSLTNTRLPWSIARNGSRKGAKAPGASSSANMLSNTSESMGDRDAGASHHSATNHGKDSSYHSSSHRSPIRAPSSISRSSSLDKDPRGAAPKKERRVDAESVRPQDSSNRRPAAKAEDMRKLAPSISVCGSNSWGQCGQDQALNEPKEEQQLAFGDLPVYLLEGHRKEEEEEDDWAPELTQVQLEDARVVWVSAGSATTMAMTDAGGILVWGDNTRGQLGRPAATASCSHVPLKLPALRAGAGPLLRRGRSGAARPARHVSLGGEHAAAITVDGLMFVWGDNMSGQLGFQVKFLRFARSKQAFAGRCTHALCSSEIFDHGDSTTVRRQCPPGIPLDCLPCACNCSPRGVGGCGCVPSRPIWG